MKTFTILAPLLTLLLALPTLAAASSATPLMQAVADGDVAAVDRLLAAGASPLEATRLGQTPLHLAMNAPPAVTARLITAGADVDARDAGGVSVLMTAAGAGRADLVAGLLEAGARVDFKDYQGATAADWAAREGHAALARDLEARIAAPAAGPAAGGDQDFAEDVFVDVKFPEWFKLSFLDLDVDLEQALEAGKQGILVFVSTRRCSYCKAFIDRSLAQPDIRERLEAAYDVIGLEIFDDTPMTAVDGSQYRVKDFVTAEQASLTPTLIFYGAGGRQLLKIVGYYPPERFRRVLDYLEGGHHHELTLRDYLEGREADATGGEAPTGLQDDPLFAAPPHILDRRGAAADRPLMVLFEEPGCPPCARFHRRVLADPAIRRLLGDYEARRLDIGSDATRVVTPAGQRRTAAEWYRDLGLTYAPAVVLFDTRGREAMRIDSETQRFRMEGTLQLVLEGAHEDDAQLQRWRRDKAVQALRARAAQ